MWGLVLSAITIAISMATKSSNDDDKAIVKTTATTTLESKLSQTFVSGLCTLVVYGSMSIMISFHKNDFLSYANTIFIFICFHFHTTQ